MFSSSIMATTPLTNGAAIDVPDILRNEVSEVNHVETMSVPGANTSMHDPKFDEGTFPSAWLIPPTVIANGSDAGEYEHASRLLFPAAITTEILSSMSETMAPFNAIEKEPPRLKFATAGLVSTWSSMIHSTAASTFAVEPPPVQFNTRTGMRLTSFATP